MVGRQPQTNNRGEILAVAQKFYKEKHTPNELENLSKDGSFCIHDLKEALPSIKYPAMNYQMYNLIANGTLVKMHSSYPCKTFSKAHPYYKFVDPFRKQTPLEEQVANEETSKTVDIKTGRLIEIKNDKIGLGIGRIREISIKITDGELQLCIKKD